MDHTPLYYAAMRGVLPQGPGEEFARSKERGTLYADLYHYLIQFCSDDAKQTVELPDELEGAQRTAFRMMCASLNLGEKVQSSGQRRVLMITKKGPRKEKNRPKPETNIELPDEVPEVIQFYRERDPPYGCFSNFSAHPIELDGLQWPTTEHYFQAMKFAGVDETYKEIVRNARNPTDAKALGRTSPMPRRSDWEEIKDEIMYKCVLAKFGQHEDIRRILLSTKEATLVEHTASDRYWADGGDGSGLNMLGKTLMRVRSTLREQSD